MSSIIYKDGNYTLQGHCTLQEVPLLHKELAGYWLQGKGDIFVDLSAVDKADSSILALLLSWKAEAIKQQRNFVVTALPEKLKILAKMSGVDALLLK